MSLAEGIVAALTNHLYAGSYLLMTEGVACAKEMLIFAGAVDEDRLVVEAEVVVCCVCRDGIATYGTGPADTADAEGCAHVVEGDEGGLTHWVVIAVVVVGPLQH